VCFILAVAVLAPVRADARDPGDIDHQIAAASEKLESLIEQRNAARADLEATQTRAAMVSARANELAAGLGVAQQRVGQIAASAYRQGPASRFTAALAAESPADLLGRMAAFQALGTAEGVRLRDLAAQLESARREEATLRALSLVTQEQAESLAAMTTEVERDLAHLRQLRARAAASATPVVPLPAAAASGAGAAVVAFAYAQIGRPYWYGAAGPDAYDCSGLAMAAWAAAGVALPHNAARQYGSVPHVSRSELAPGDLVFYYSDLHHVAIYVGDGVVVHAPTSGETVRAQAMDMAPIAGYGRP